MFKQRLSEIGAGQRRRDEPEYRQSDDVDRLKPFQLRPASRYAS